MTEQNEPSADPEMDRARQLAEEWQRAAREAQQREGIVPDPVRRDGRVRFHLSRGALARLWHEPHSISGDVLGLRRVADGGPYALVLALGSYGLRAARPADGSAWAPDLHAESAWLDGPDATVTLWPVDDTETVRSPADVEAWQVEEWRMRTYRQERGR